MTEEEDAVLEAQLGDPLLEMLPLRTFARAEKLRARQALREERGSLDQCAMSLDGPEIADDRDADVLGPDGQRPLKRLRGEGIEMRQVDPVAHHHHAIGLAALVPDAHFADRVGVDDDQVSVARVPLLGFAVPLAEPVAQVAEVDPADDHLGACETGGGQSEQVGIEVRRVHDADVFFPDQRGDAGDLLERVGPHHGAAQREEVRLVSQRTYLVEHRTGQFQATHQRLETGGMPPQPFDELPLGASDPEAIDEVQDADFHLPPKWGRPECPASPLTGGRSLGDAPRQPASRPPALPLDGS